MAVTTMTIILMPTAMSMTTMTTMTTFLDDNITLPLLAAWSGYHDACSPVRKTCRDCLVLDPAIASCYRHANTLRISCPT